MTEDDGNYNDVITSIKSKLIEDFTDLMEEEKDIIIVKGVSYIKCETVIDLILNSK